MPIINLSTSFESALCSLRGLIYGMDHHAFQGRQGCCLLQDVTQSMCEGPDRESEADEKRKENKEREEREALRCARYPISTQNPSMAWKNTIRIMYGPHNCVCSSRLGKFWTAESGDQLWMDESWETIHTFPVCPRAKFAAAMQGVFCS